MKRLNILLCFLISASFAQETILKQTTFSTSAINTTGDNSVMVGTVGQTFVGESESNSTVLTIIREFEMNRYKANIGSAKKWQHFTFSLIFVIFKT